MANTALERSMVVDVPDLCLFSSWTVCVPTSGVRMLVTPPKLSLVTEELAQSFIPIVVQFDDFVQIAFETQRDPDGQVAVYLPGAPNPWSVTVVYVSNERVKPLPITLTEALRNIRTLGRGSIGTAGPKRAA